MWPFKSKKPPPELPKLIFKGPESFFSYQCKFGVTDILPRQGLVGLVSAGADQSITEENRNNDEHQSVGLRVVSPDGGFEVIAQTFSRGPLLRSGDAVIWVPLHYDESLSALTGDKRSGWIGFVVAKIMPEIDPARPSFEILHDFG